MSPPPPARPTVGLVLWSLETVSGSRRGRPDPELPSAEGEGGRGRVSPEAQAERPWAAISLRGRAG